MTNQKRDSAKQYIRAEFVPSSMNAENRTVDVTFATGTPVLRYSWARDEYYNEVLDMNGADLARAENGLPVLDNHGTWGSVGQILGRAENIRKENGVFVATVRFSKRDNVKDIVADVQDGVIRDISFGYKVLKMQREEKKDGQQYRDYLVTSWQPTEISFVTIPADPKAGVRSDDDNTESPEIIDLEPTRSNIPMTDQEKKAIADAERSRAADITKAVADAGLSASFAQRLISEGRELESARSLITAEKERVSNDPKAIADAAIKAERTRTAEITKAVRSAKLGTEFAQSLIDGDKSLDEARALIIEEMGKGDSFTGSRSAVSVGADRQAEHTMLAAEAALVGRADRTLLDPKKSNYSEDVIRSSQEFRGHRLLDFAKDALKRAGVETRGLDPMEIVARAFTSSTSDFPVLLEGTNRRILLANYNAVADTWRQFCATGSVSDFRDYKRLRMGTFSDLESLTENGEYRNKKITDADYEKVNIGTKGNIINVSRKMIINDDLSAFTRLSAMLGRAAARSIENDVYAYLASNPTLVDGKALFHADHNNITGTAAAPTVLVLDAMRQQMAQHKDKDANDYLDIRPSLALAPLSLGSTLRVLNGSQYDPDAANKLQRPNIVNGLLSSVVDTPRLSGTAWYMFADPTNEPVFEVNFLNGQQSPYMESQNGFEVDGIQWKIRLDYGVGAVGYRGVLKNAGA